MAERKNDEMDGAEAVATLDSGATAAEHQMTVETPDEIVTQKAAVKATPEDRRMAMAQENASAMTPVSDDSVRKARDLRAAQMAQENTRSGTTVRDEDDREERALRAAQMAQENTSVSAR